MCKVIIDTDFLNHILKTPHGEAIMTAIKNYYGFHFCMHPWVYDREIRGLNTKVESFVQKNVEVFDYADFISSPVEGMMYEIYFKEIYRAMNRKELDLGGQTYQTYNKSQENLGEIHSVIMAMFTNIPLLLSDDYNAKEIAAKRINSSGYFLDVKKSFDILCEIISKDKTVIEKNDVYSVIDNYKRDHKALKKQIDALYKAVETDIVK